MSNLSFTSRIHYSCARSVLPNSTFNSTFLVMNRFGFPCVHIFRVVPGTVKHNMVSIQYWLMYHPYYASDCAIGRAIRVAQSEQIDCAKLGVPVDDQKLDGGLISGGGCVVDNYPRFYTNTSEYDASEAMFVMSCPTVTKEDMKKWRVEQSESSYNNSEPDFCTNAALCDEENVNDEKQSVVEGMSLVKDDNYVVLSKRTKRLHMEIDYARPEMTGPPSEELKMEAWKTIKDCYDLVTQDKYCTGNDVKEFMTDAIALRDKYFSQKSELRGVASAPHQGLPHHAKCYLYEGLKKD